ncbi:MAG: BolA family protein [Parvibaculum sp.]|nr:BolA family protein [Parvibaculum sp.]
MTVAEIITEKLKKAFSPSTLIVEDQSHQHKGHAGHREGVETHFHVTIVSDAFDGVLRVARHRMVTNVLKDEIGNPVHALALKTQTPAEAARDA